MAELDLIFLGDNGDEVGLDFVGVGLIGESEALGDAGDVAIDANARDAKGVAEEDIGGLAADAGEFEEVVEVARDFAVEFLDDHAAGALNALGFHAAAEDFVELALERGEGDGDPVRGGAVFLEEGRGDDIDEVVAELGGED